LFDIPAAAIGPLIASAVVPILLVAVVGLGVRIAAMHWLAGRKAETGSIETTIVVCCWSYAPLTLELGVVALLRWSRAQTKEFVVLYPADFAANFDSVFSEIGWAEQVVAVLAVAWSVYVLADGVAATHGVERRQTFSVAVAIGAVHLLV
jgi:hypothetical protein